MLRIKTLNIVNSMLDWKLSGMSQNLKLAEIHFFCTQGHILDSFVQNYKFIHDCSSFELIMSSNTTESYTNGARGAQNISVFFLYL